MASEKYISMKESLTGFSFANLGLFYGFGNSVIGAVYALVLMDIFHNSSIVGVYISLSYGLVILLTLTTSEFFRRFTKRRIFYSSMLVAGGFFYDGIFGQAINFYCSGPGFLAAMVAYRSMYSIIFIRFFQGARDGQTKQSVLYLAEHRLRGRAHYCHVCCRKIWKQVCVFCSKRNNVCWIIIFQQLQIGIRRQAY